MDVFLAIRRIDTIPNSKIRELCNVKKWFSHTKRMKNCRIVKRIYEWEVYYGNFEKAGLINLMFVFSSCGCV